MYRYFCNQCSLINTVITGITVKVNETRLAGGCDVLAHYYAGLLTHKHYEPNYKVL